MVNNLVFTWPKIQNVYFSMGFERSHGILVMVQKSGEYQLRLEVYLPLFTQSHINSVPRKSTMYRCITT